MSAVPSAVAALDGHRGMAVVAENGLGFLYNQSVAPENRVRLGVVGSVVGHGGWVHRAGGHVAPRDRSVVVHQECVVFGVNLQSLSLHMFRIVWYLLLLCARSR